MFIRYVLHQYLEKKEKTQGRTTSPVRVSFGYKRGGNIFFARGYVFKEKEITNSQVE